MKIARKSDRLKFCQYYLKEVRPEALASEISDYIATHNYGRNRI